MSDSARPHGLQPARLLCPWASPGSNTGVGCHFLLQGVLAPQGLNPSLLCLLHWQVNSLPKSASEIHLRRPSFLCPPGPPEPTPAPPWPLHRSCSPGGSPAGRLRSLQFHVRHAPQRSLPCQPRERRPPASLSPSMASPFVLIYRFPHFLRQSQLRVFGHFLCAKTLLKACDFILAHLVIICTTLTLQLRRQV